MSGGVSASLRNSEQLGGEAKRLLTQRQPAQAEAVCRQALRLDPENHAILNLLGLSLLEQGKPAEAEPIFSKILQKHPNLPNIGFNLALSLFSQGKLDEAIDRLRHCVQVAPNVAQIQVKLGQLLLMKGQPDEALEFFKGALKLESNFIPAKLNLSEALFELDRVQEAEQVIGEVLAQAPGDLNALHALGKLLQHQGRFEEARECFKNIVAKNPESIAARFSMIYSGKVSEADRPFIDEMTAMADAPRRGLEERFHLHYAVGKSFDDLKEFESAMRHFDAANALALEVKERAGSRFDGAIYSESMDRIGKLASDLGAEGSSQSERPIFIVGMVRSGTTLMEQILAAHPDVAAGGERQYWLACVSDALNQGMGEGWLAKAVSGYEAVLNGISKDALRVTDKMPTNYQVLGVLLKAYPKARVIHCRRSPLDNALSVYVTPYRSAPEFGHSKADIVFGYREYERLMARWRANFPDAKILDVQYEELTADFERVARGIIEFVGLDWNDRCLSPNEFAKGVRTPSQWQVSRPIYRSSIERWRNYRPWLGALLELQS